jgi:electron transport complex protein RnfG
MKNMLRYGFILALICTVATGLLAYVNWVTKPKIIIQAQKETEDSLREVLPAGTDFQPVKSKEKIIYYKAYDKDKNFVGVAFIAQAKGYSDKIETMVGMTKDATITAIKVLNQNETPGLGARITEVQDNTTIFDLFKGKKKEQAKRPWFQEQFTQKTISELNGVVAITGATISSKAVTDSVKAKAKEIQTLIKDK